MFRRNWWLILLVLVSACVGPQIQHGQLVSLGLGMQPQITVEKLGLPPLATRMVSVDGGDYLFHQYALNNGMTSDMYYLAFERNQLKYWGYVDDFRRHPDSRLNRAMDAAISAFTPQPK